MKKLALVFPLFMLFISCSGESESENQERSEVVVDTTTSSEELPQLVNSITIEENTVGVFKIGEEVPEHLPEELSIRQFVEEEKMGETTTEHTHNIIFNQLEDLVELFMDQGTGEHYNDMLIKEMWVLSNYYETAEHIHVGSTIHDFEGAYPNVKGWYAPEIDQFFLDTEDLLGAQFIISEENVSQKKPNGNTIAPVPLSAFDQQAEIVKIRLY